MTVEAIPVKHKLYLNSFVRHLRAQNASERTVQTYSEAVAQLTRYLDEMGMPAAPDAITREHVVDVHGPPAEEASSPPPPTTDTGACSSISSGWWTKAGSERTLWPA